MLFVCYVVLWLRGLCLLSLGLVVSLLIMLGVFDLLRLVLVIVLVVCVIGGGRRLFGYLSSLLFFGFVSWWVWGFLVLCFCCLSDWLYVMGCLDFG